MAERDERIDPELVSEIDTGALKPSAELADARDRRRAFADEPEPTEE